MSDAALPAPALIWCPFPDRDSAQEVMVTLLDEKLIACANVFPEIASLFEWDGERGQAKEAGVLVKTNVAVLDKAVGRMNELHPYQAPAIVGWRCDAAAPATAAWLGGLGGAP